MELETFFTVTEQSQLLLYAVLMGIPMGLCFDILRTFRLLIPHGKLAVAVEDVAFLLLCGGALLCFAVVLARGEIRAYYALGALLGFLLYYCTLGTVTVPVLRRILLLLKKGLCFLLRPLFHAGVRIRSVFARKFVHFSKVSEKALFFFRFPLIIPEKMVYNKERKFQKQEAVRLWQKRKKDPDGSSDSSSTPL